MSQTAEKKAPAHPDVKTFLTPEIRNWRGLLTGEIRPAPSFP